MRNKSQVSAVSALVVSAALSVALYGCISDGGKTEPPPIPLTTFSVSPDTTVTLHDRVELRGTVSRTHGSIVKREWDIGATGSFVATSSEEMTFTAGSAAETVLCIFRATDEAGAAVLDTVRVEIVEDLPTADAGSDTLVTIRDTLRLAGVAVDGLGTIVKQEWKLGSQQDFAEAQEGVIAYVSAAASGEDSLVFRATDDDGHVATSVRVVTVTDDEPAIKLTAEARTVQEGDGFRIQSKVDDFGRIVKWEWNLGPNGTFVTGSKGDTIAFATGPAFGSFALKLRVTDDDGNTSVKTMELPVSKWKFLATHPHPGESYLVGGANGWIYSTRYYVRGSYTYQVPTPAKSNGSSGYEETPFSVWDFLGLGSNIYAITSTGAPPHGLLLYSKIAGSSSSAWIERSTLPDMDYQASASSTNTLYVSGIDRSTGLLSLYAYDRQEDTWTALAPAPLAMWGYSMAESDGKLYLTGGQTARGLDESWRPRDPNNRLFVFDIATNSWEEKAAAPEKWINFWMVSAKGRIYMGGGGAIGASFNVFEYDPATDIWKRKSVLLFPTDPGKNATSIDGKIYVVDRGRIQIYDPAEDP